MTSNDQLFTQSNLAQRLHISERTLERWRVEGCGPPYTKAVRKVLYRQSDVDEWLDGSLRQSTSEIVGAER
jgi:predicted site-specific integrase-resolvase